MTWTDERITELTELWECGCPTGEIAKIMGLTKNQIIGKAHRLELPGRPSPIVRNRPATAPKKRVRSLVWTPERNARLTELHKAGSSNEAIAEDLGLRERSVIGQLSRLGLTRQPKRKPYKEPAPVPRRAYPEPPISRHRTCQFIAGEPSADDSCKCGDPAQLGSSFCPEHHAVCWQTLPKASAA